MDRRNTLKTLTLGAASLCLPSPGAGATKPNVLLICVDDLRPVMGCYGGKILTPNMDRFAETGATFTHHYVQWPVCGPSRSCMMSGLRPDTTGIYGNGGTGIIAQHPDTRPTMPLHFRNNGYTTMSFGKIYHGRNTESGFGWSTTPWNPSSGWTCYVDWSGPKNGTKINGITPYRPIHEIYNGPDNLHGDYQTADQTIQALEQNREGPFYLAAGFYKPHLPFVAPRRFWDLYDHDDIHPTDNPGLPENAADFMYHSSEIWTYGMSGRLFTGATPPTAEQARTMIHAYYAAVSFIDAQIGRILSRLDDLGLRDNTAVIIWGDHGFHLGDHRRWAKHTQFENAMRSPLMVRFPGRQKADLISPAIVETVDIYPSLCDYCTLSPPDHLEGVSFGRAVAGSDPEGKIAAYSQISPLTRQERHLMAYSIRTRNFRYVEWRDTKRRYAVVHTELYDHRTDPRETVNAAGLSRYAADITEHARLVRSGYASLQQ
jgi:iduronate 2-sulfatase